MIEKVKEQYLWYQHLYDKVENIDRGTLKRHYTNPSVWQISLSADTPEQNERLFHSRQISAKSFKSWRRTQAQWRIIKWIIVWRHLVHMVCKLNVCYITLAQ